jgi:hypothetical protein
MSGPQVAIVSIDAAPLVLFIRTATAHGAPGARAERSRFGPRQTGGP